MIRNTCLISDGSPILAGIATGLVLRVATAGRRDILRQIPVVVLENLLVIAARVPLFGTGTMLTVPLSW